MSFDRIMDTFLRLVRVETKKFDHYALYACKIIAQNADDSLELLPDSPKIPHHSKVPIRLGIPGVRVQVLPGSSVMLGFENGDQQKPYASIFEIGTITALHLGVPIGVPAPFSVAQGETLNAAIATLGGVIAGALTTMGASPGTPMPGALAVTAGTAITGGVTAFTAAAAAALSPKVKVL